ncbi:transporter substrate-binding domain-containing protein [Chromobacterium haemolyticum]|nr:transporter substrate-binding domain-containing protein [Chromobacterium haemolyticum]
MTASIRRFGLTLLLLLGACLAGPCRGQDAETLTVAVDANAPPFMYEENERVGGLYPRLVSAVCDKAGIPHVFRALTWRRALFELDRSAMAAAGIYKTVNREQRYDFSLPLYQEHIVVVYLRQHPIEFRGLPDLDNKRVGVMAGWSYGDEFDRARADKRFIAYEGDSDRQNLLLLQRGNLTTQCWRYRRRWTPGCKTAPIPTWRWRRPSWPAKPLIWPSTKPRRNCRCCTASIRHWRKCVRTAVINSW